MQYVFSSTLIFSTKFKIKYKVSLETQGNLLILPFVKLKASYTVPTLNCTGCKLLFQQGGMGYWKGIDEPRQDENPVLRTLIPYLSDQITAQQDPSCTLCLYSLVCTLAHDLKVELKHPHL